jgi:hypothetical protein
MNQTLIDKYQISFSNVVQDVRGYPKKITKLPITINDRFTEFLYNWSSANEINETLLPVINNVLNGNVIEDTCASETVGTIIEKENTIFYSLIDESPTINIAFNIPTQDFKDVVEGWVEFLSAKGL